MKWFLILLAIGLAASDKLDRTYLPPPGAQFAGGNPGDIKAPLELPNPPQSGTIQLGPSLTGLQDFGTSGQPIQLPITTTSYAFTQTTTYPPIENYETTILPINPVTGFPVQNVYQPNIQTLPGYTQSNGQLVPSHNANIQTGYAPQGTISDQSVNIGNPIYTQTNNQPSVVIPGGDNLIPVASPQQPGINEDVIQYPGSLTSSSNQYPNQNASPEDTVQISGSRSHSPDGYQDSQQYTSGKIIPGQQGSIQSTISPQQTTPNTLTGDQFIEIGHKGPLIEEYPQGTYSSQPKNVQDNKTPHINQGYENQGSLVHDGSQQSIIEYQNLPSPGLTLAKESYQPVQKDNSVSSTTPVTGLVSSTSAYSTAGPIIRPDRPQAAGERNAVIINYENVRTPNSYFYSYDTSNGIHADESGTVGDGTRAQGAYSYIGDDGKVYSVIYTADENGFQPHGDHIPTPPPIPEAIQKVIEQAARDKAAGIVDDGSYDEAKYGHQNYQNPMHHRRPQIHGTDKLMNTQRSDVQKEKIRPISGITENDYDEIMPPNQFNENILDSGIIKPTVNHPLRYPSEINTGYDDITGVSNMQRERNEYPSVSGENFPEVETNNNIQQDKYNLKRPGSSGRQPISNDGVKDTKTQYPGTIVKDTEKTGHYPDNKTGNDSGFENSVYQNIGDVSPEYNSPDQTSETLNNVSPTMGVRKQASKLRTKGNRRPSITGDKELQIDPSSKQGDIDDFVDTLTDSKPTGNEFSQNNANEKISSHKTNQQIDENGYYYDSPRIQFGQTQFPSRFKVQEMPSISTTIPHKDQGLNLRPFQTPDVYNQPSGSQQNRKQYGNQQLTTLRPFMTSSVTTPKDSSYSDYDDGEDYGIDRNVNYEGLTTRADKNVYPGNRRISQPTQTTSKPQHTPFGQGTRITEKGTVKPNQGSDYYNSVSPDYNYGSTTPLPSQSSRFGTTEAPKKTIEQRQRRPSTSRKPGSSTAVGRPVLSSTSTTETPDKKYQTTSSSLRYPSSTIAPSYSSNEAQPGYDSRKPYGQTGSTAQNYPSYTTTSGTAVPSAPGFQPGSGAFVPSSITGTYQPSIIGTYQTRQENEPVRYSMTGIPQTPDPTSFVPGTYSTSTPGYYQTTYQKSPDNTYTTVGPSTSVRPGSLISSGPRTTTSGSSPTGPYQTSYQYTSPTADYATTSTPETTSNFGSPIDTGTSVSYYSQPSASGYQYGRPGTVYSTAGSPSTIGTTPGSFTPSTTPGRPYQEYATTQRPTYPTTQGVYGQSPVVDGFGRPIMSEQQPGYPSVGQELGQYPGTRVMDGNNFRGPGSNGLPSGVVSNDNLRPMYGGDQSSNYPGYYGQPQVIGEDFSGPKQPQRFDPQTGYHY